MSFHGPVSATPGARVGAALTSSTETAVAQIVSEDWQGVDVDVWWQVAVADDASCLHPAELASSKHLLDTVRLDENPEPVAWFAITASLAASP
jgi:hypothetical protein